MVLSLTDLIMNNYPVYNPDTRKTEFIPVSQLSEVYKKAQIYYHKNRIKESEYFISLLS